MPQQENSRAAGTLYGALGGVMGAAAMTILRAALRRRAVLMKTVPETAEEWLAYSSPALRSLRNPVWHHVLGQAMHLGYGASLAGAFFAITGGGPGGGPRRQRELASRALAAVCLATGGWLVGSWVMMPALGVTRPPWRARVQENAADLAAHLVFGAISILVADDLSAQRHHRPTSDWRRHRTSVG